MLYYFGMAKNITTTWVDKALLKEIRIIAAYRDQKIRQVLNEALRQYIDANPTSKERKERK